MADALESILLIRRILCREALATAHMEWDRLSQSLPVLMLAAGFAFVVAVGMAILGFSALAAGLDSGVTAAGTWGVAAILGLMTRPFAARLGDLGSLPHWRVRQVLGELLFTATMLLPILVLMAAGWLLFLASGNTTPEMALLGLLRLMILAVVCLTVGWAGLAGRGWQAWLVTGCSGVAAGFLLLALPGWAGLALTPLLLPWIWRSPAPAGPGWRLPRPDLPVVALVGQLARERPSETGLRLGTGILIALVGWAWLGSVPAESGPLALVFIGGLVGLAVHGLVHLASGFREARRELVDVLPIAPWRWLALGMVLPLGILATLALALGGRLLAEGLTPGPVFLALATILAQGALTVLLVHRAPAAGGLLATVIHIAAIRTAVAVVR